MKLRAAALALAAFTLITQTGCSLSTGIYSNFRAIEHLQIIGTLGLDAAAAGVRLSASGGAPSDGAQPAVFENSARDLISAMDALQDLSDNAQLFFAHTQHIVLGRDAAQQGIGTLLDFVERDVNLRMGTELFVLRSGEAGALLRDAAQQGGISETLDTIRRETSVSGASHVYNFRSTAVALEEYGAALVCALRTQDAQDKRQPESEAPAVSADGYGILKGAKLVGFIDGREAEAVSLVHGNLGNVSRMVSDGAGGTVSLEISRAEADIRLVSDESTAASPVLEIRARLGAVVTEKSSDRTELVDEEMLDLFSSQLAAQFEQDIASAVALSQKLDADFLALGKPLRLAGETVALPDAEIRVCVEAVIDHSYEMEHPVGMNSAKAGGT